MQYYNALTYRIALAKCRCSNDKFGIETGRHNTIDCEQRICMYCFQKLNKNIVECEFHCQKYDDIRNVFLFNWYTNDTIITIFVFIAQ